MGVGSVQASHSASFMPPAFPVGVEAPLFWPTVRRQTRAVAAESRSRLLIRLSSSAGYSCWGLASPSSFAPPHRPAVVTEAAMPCLLRLLGAVLLVVLALL